MITNQLVLF